jgi:hypothetical protein
MKKMPKQEKPKCGLCGKSKNLKKTECCDQWICDDEHKYILFSYAANSCSRNHRRYTLCAVHHAEKHPGKWQECQECREGYEPEMVVYYGTNAFNFEKLPNPPKYEPTHCSLCSGIIRLSADAYTMSGDQILCTRCAPI